MAMVLGMKQVEKHQRVGHGMFSNRDRMLEALALFLAALALAACGGEDEAAPRDRVVESQIYIALAWESLDADQRRLVCELTAGELEDFLDGLELADGEPPDSKGVQDYLSLVC